ncbi:MAG: hypothetical protein EXR95_00830 [Gemmatimonadetes bacterium]|nr:hypothetical protein [Gemmatimonadota bacterium]
MTPWARMAMSGGRMAVFLLAWALCAPAAARAQGPERTPAERANLERRVRERFAETVRAELGITQEQLERVGQVQSSFQQRRQDLFRRDLALRRRMRPTASAPRTETEARELLRDLTAVREEEARLFRSEMDGLLEVLTAPQVLRFYELREQLMDRVRRVRGGPGRAGQRGPGPGLRPGR